MNTFIENYDIYLTPLTPIHIGCGEDFEPTNYVIDNEILYHFEPSQLPLNEIQQDKLFNAVKGCDLLAVQRFYKDNKRFYAGIAHYFSKVSCSFQNEWEDKLGKTANKENDGKKVFNSFQIERQTYLPFLNQPYIPASSVKGALATAYLDNCHKQKSNNARVKKGEDKNLKKDYIGDFQKSHYAHLSFGDFMPTMDNTSTKIFYAINHSRKNKNREKSPLSNRRECILGGQYRSFKSELSIREQNKSFDLIKDFSLLHHYSLSLFEEEMNALFECGLISNETKNAFKNIVSMKNIYLIRLGKNGADSKIYRGKGVAQINIPQNKKTVDRPLTWWLAGNETKQKIDLLPFGWAILEINPTSEHTLLKNWCETYGEERIDLNKIKQHHQSIQEYIHKMETDRKLALQQKQLKLQAEQERFANLSENQKIIEQKIKDWENSCYEVKPYTDNTIFSEAKALIEKAINENWDKADKVALFSIFDYQNKESVFNKKVLNLDLSKGAGKLKGSAKAFKQLLNQLQGL